ncbi:epoxyqueuosine reductase QueH [bacterium]|nr:epoxyqueuosine reductase QueH [bacterium]
MKILLHTCCATCLGYPYVLLSEYYDITIFYYNPNIYPESEYLKRLEDIRKYTKEFSIHLLTGEYDYNSWENYVKGFEKEPEGGKRCERCFEFRLRETASMAKSHNFDYFASTMSISPHKNFNVINEIGKNLEKYYAVSYFESNFKKKDGFKKTIEISREHAFYRQNYCGCKYSIRKI